MGMANDRHQRTKRQHYVPRCYLRRFSADGDSVWVFDKFSKKPFRSGVMGVAQEHGFHDIAVPLSVGQPQPAERMLSRVEADFTATVPRFIAQVKAGRVTEDVRNRVALHTAIQSIRTRRHREVMYELTRTYHEVMTEEYRKRGFEGLPPDDGLFPSPTARRCPPSRSRTSSTASSSPSWLLTSSGTSGCCGRTSPASRCTRRTTPS
jgi:hypothetical protein